MIMPQNYSINTYRNGAAKAQYAVPATDGTATGSYTCTVTISAITSKESTGYLVTATGLFFNML